MSSPQAIPSAGRPLSAGAIALMLMLCLTWGFNQIAVKLVLPDIPPMLQAMIRSMGALPVLFIIGSLRGVKFFETEGSRRLLRVTEPKTLEHDEHDPIPLPRGNPEVIRQREYSPEAIRNVAD